MSSRNTTSGASFEDIVGASLKRSCKANALTATAQVNIGEKPDGGNHIVDWQLTSNTKRSKKKVLVSCKYQEVSGTAQDKITYEVVKLATAMKNDPSITHSFIVLGGKGWSSGMKDFVTTDLVSDWFPKFEDKITICDIDSFMGTLINV